MVSVRARLALWYAGVFALFLGAFSASGYVLVSRSSLARVDESLLEGVVAVAAALDLEAEEQGDPRQFIPHVVEEFRFHDLAVAVLEKGTGRLLAGWSADSESTDTITSPQVNGALARARDGTPVYSTVETPAGPARVVVVRRPVGKVDVVLGAVHSLQAQHQLLRELKFALAAAVPLVLLFATAGGYFLARKSLRPVTVMAERAAHIGATTLHERLPMPKQRDELGQLALVFNELLARLDRAFDQQRQFIADASHELRTPVAILTGEAELALSQPNRSREELQSALETMRAEAERLQRIVEDLFLLARSDAGERLVQPEEIYLGELAGECVRAVRTLAARKGVTISYEGSEDLPFAGDNGLLRRAVLNLLDNAIKFTPTGGTVKVRGKEGEGRYALEVVDSGPGIAPEALPHVFDRFFRVREGPRGSDIPGAGLGLAIARRIAEAHGGTLELTRSDRGGTIFTLFFLTGVHESIGAAPT